MSYKSDLVVSKDSWLRSKMQLHITHQGWFAIRMNPDRQGRNEPESRDSQGPYLLTWFNLAPAWISNYTHIKLWDYITYPFPNFKDATIEVMEWISNFIPHFTGHVITYPSLDLSESILVKGVKGSSFPFIVRHLYIETPLNPLWFSVLCGLR